MWTTFRRASLTSASPPPTNITSQSLENHWSPKHTPSCHSGSSDTYPPPPSSPCPGWSSGMSIRIFTRETASLSLVPAARCIVSTRLRTRICNSCLRIAFSPSPALSTDLTEVLACSPLFREAVRTVRIVGWNATDVPDGCNHDIVFKSLDGGIMTILENAPHIYFLTLDLNMTKVTSPKPSRRSHGREQSATCTSQCFWP
jgi:hypothetical protein